jgi:hypothetical protein
MSTRFSSVRAAAASLLLSTALLAACGGGSDSPPATPAPNAISVLPVSGSTLGGTAVVLTGTDFVTGATVTVGGTAATGVSVTSATAIAFTTPAHAAGAVDVVVRNPDGQTDTLAGAFTYVAPVDTVWVVPDAAVALTAPQRTAFTDGNLYVNAHTTANGAGEIRGQLDNAGTVVRLASLDGTQEGLTGITGFGAGILQVDTSAGPSLGKVRGFVITSGLVNITNAHVHRALRTVPPTPGGVVINLVPAGASKDMWVVPDDAPALSQTLIDAFVAGELYYNVHTAVNTGGEIRGQLDKSGTFKLASLNAAQEPAVTSTALGAGILAVNETTGAVAGFAVTTPFATNVTNAHVHQGARLTPPVSGPVVTAMKFGPSLVVVPDDAAALTATGITQFQTDLLYFNVHTTANGGGEIRGQLDKTGTVRVAAMDGAQERATPVTTAAVGAGLVAVDDTTGEVSGFIVTRGLVSPTVAHIHQGARGAGGGPIVDLAKP